MYMVWLLPEMLWTIVATISSFALGMIAKILTEENPFLHLTGPSRAIMSGDTVMIEVQLQLKGRVQSEDAVLIGKAFTYDDDDHDDHGDSHLQGLCTIVLSCEHLEQSVQATILSVCAVQGSLPWGNGIVCSALSLDKTEVGDR
eukprot:UN07000